METATSTRRRLPVSIIIAASVALLAVALAAFYLSRPARSGVSGGQASGEAKAYVGNLRLSDVTMQATENFMQQQVVEVQGTIANAGPRPLQTVEVYCLFRGVDGHEVGRQRLPIVHSNKRPLRPGETRGFRLPFDSVPDGWNQAMPAMMIAQIAFAE